MSRLFGRRRKPILIDVHRYSASACWFCRGSLPVSFTTVLKSGQRLPVHLGCRQDAEDLIAGKWIQENEDFPDLEMERPIG